MTITVVALTPKIVAYCCRQEGIGREAYKDSAGVWTWAGGIATTSGFDVLQYKDKPRPLDVCLRATIDLMKARYWPVVQSVFEGHVLSEVQYAAALSFQWHFGKLRQADWVETWLAGDHAKAREEFMQWTDHGRALERAKTERAMFFDGEWPADLRVPVYSVAKPSYQPTKPVMTDVLPMVQQILGGA